MSSREESGFSLLEAMLAVVVLMVGVATIAQLNKGVMGQLSPAGDAGLDYPEVVEHLLRDQAELIRAHREGPASPSTYPTIPPLEVTPASYSTAVTLLAHATGSFGGITYGMATYSIEVRRHPSDQLVGQTLLTRLATLSESVPSVGRVGL